MVSISRAESCPSFQIASCKETYVLRDRNVTIPEAQPQRPINPSYLSKSPFGGARENTMGSPRKEFLGSRESGESTNFAESPFH